jgi:hypothetical protein
MDDDALYEQEDSDDEKWGSDLKSDSSELRRIGLATNQQKARTTIRRQFSPRHPVQTESESDSESKSDKAVIRPTNWQSINPTTMAARPTGQPTSSDYSQQ